MARILGSSGFGRLAKGYPVNINDIDVKPFTVSSSAPADGIAAGSLLVMTSTPNVLTTVDPVESASTYANKIAGIALATNVKLDTVFPQSAGEVTWERGQAGGCAVRGEIAVEFTGTAPAPGAPVYYVIASNKFTTNSAGTNIALANMTFTGNTQGSLTVVDIRY